MMIYECGRCGDVNNGGGCDCRDIAEKNRITDEGARVRMLFAGWFAEFNNENVQK